MNHMIRVADLFDPPEILDAGVTAIPASTGSPLQVVASLAETIVSVRVKDGIQTDFIGIYSGPVGQERFEFSIGGGSYEVASCRLGRGSRISIRSMGAALTTGTLYIEFQGVYSYSEFQGT